MKKLLLGIIRRIRGTSFSVAAPTRMTVSEFIALDPNKQYAICLEYVKLGVESGRYERIHANLISRDNTTAIGYAMICSAVIKVHAKGNEEMQAYDLWLLKDNNLRKK